MVQGEIKRALLAAIKKTYPEVDSWEVIAILQKQDNKQIWNVLIMLEGFKLLRLHLDCNTGEIIKREDINIMDFTQTLKGKK